MTEKGGLGQSLEKDQICQTLRKRGTAKKTANSEELAESVASQRLEKENSSRKKR